MKPGKLLIPILLGLLAGIIALAAFNFLLPFLELQLIGPSNVQGPEEIERFLADNHLMNTCYVLGWSLIVLISSFTAAFRAGERPGIAGVIAGGVYFTMFLSNIDFLENQVTYYLVFAAAGLIALFAPMILLKRKIQD